MTAMRVVELTPSGAPQRALVVLGPDDFTRPESESWMSFVVSGPRRIVWNRVLGLRFLVVASP